MKKLSEVLSLQLFDVAPSFKHYTPDQILAASALSTIKPENVEEILEKISEDEVKMIHRESTRRGHASITSLPSIDLVFDGSRVLDYYFTSLKYTRALILSSRRMCWRKEDILIPDEIHDSKFKRDYENILSKQFKFYSEAINEGIPIEQARKVLGFGFRSHGLLRMSLDTACELSKDVFSVYAPKEVYLFEKKLDEIVKEASPYIYDNKKKLKLSSLYPFPNIFNNPNFSPDYSEYLEHPSILKCFIHDSFWELKEKLDKGEKDENYFAKLADMAKGKIAVSYAKPMSVAVFNEEKRHGSVDMEVESIHFAAKRCLKEILSQDMKNELKSLYIPNQFGEKKKEYVKIVKDSLSLYEEMVENGIAPGDAVYVIPQGLKVVVVGVLNGYHLFHPFGYFGVRSCHTSEEEMRELTKNLIKELELIEPALKGLIGPKCKVGYCTERKYCGKIFEYNPSYSQEMHKFYNS